MTAINRKLKREQIDLEPYMHIQSTFSALWVVTHNLNKPYPNIVTTNEDGVVCEIYWESIDNNTIHVKPDLSIKGRVYVS
jgi:hypothetical protein